MDLYPCDRLKKSSGYYGFFFFTNKNLRCPFESTFLKPIFTAIISASLLGCVLKIAPSQWDWAETLREKKYSSQWQKFSILPRFEGANLTVEYALCWAAACLQLLSCWTVIVHTPQSTPYSFFSVATMFQLWDDMMMCSGWCIKCPSIHALLRFFSQ